MSENRYVCHSHRRIYIVGVLRLLALIDEVKEHSRYDKVSATVTSLSYKLLVIVKPLSVIYVDLLLALGNSPWAVSEHYPFAVTAEVFDLSIFTAKPVGIAMSTKSGTACYLEYGAIVVESGDDGGSVADSSCSNVLYYR